MSRAEDDAKIVRHYVAFLGHHRKANRAMGRYLVELIENEKPINHMLLPDGKVIGTDQYAIGLIHSCGVSSKRLRAVIRCMGETTDLLKEAREAAAKTKVAA